jgi:hypothetical protein
LQGFAGFKVKPEAAYLFIYLGFHYPDVVPAVAFDFNLGTLKP